MTPVGRLVPLLARLTAALTVLVGAVSLGSYRTGHAHPVTSQFGEVVEVFGYGVQARDSVLKSGILTGADAVCLLLGVPLLLCFAGRRGGRGCGWLRCWGSSPTTCSCCPSA